MDINRIDEYMKYGKTEIWNITSSMGGMMMGPMGGGGMMHNFHAHGVHFQVLQRNGRPVADYERGWKDTVLVDPEGSVKVIVRYLRRGLYMYHCHILEHEDSGMMGQFLVE
jgi:FtsP/CotA-like multicopper oxidase with cupredoxin domain